jgi:hypothetical protein
VVEHTHLHQRQRLLQRMGDHLVGARGLGHAARVIVCQHHRRGIALECAPRHLARVHAGLRQAAAEQDLELDQPVLGVEEEHAEHLVVERCQLQRQVVLHRLRLLEARLRGQALGEHAAGDLEHGGQLGALGRTQTLHRLQLVGARRQQPGEAPETVDQRLRELQHALPCGAGAQQQRQQLRVGQCRRPAGQQLLARSRVGWQVSQAGHGVAQGAPRKIPDQSIRCPPCP